MRLLILLIAMNLALTTTALAKSPTNDWQAVQDIPGGWQITVVTTFTFPCVFDRETTDELICEALQNNRTASDPREIRVRRDRIREVRVERRDGANMLAGSAFGGGAGAGFGAIIAAGSRGGPAYLFGALGAMLGAHAGRDIHTLRGKIVYRANQTVSPANTSAEPLPNQHSVIGRTSP
jgi:hypothetical protein